jgi:hypothetical protein
MKNKALSILVLLALLLALFPTSAFASAPAPVKVDVRNQTGGTVSLSLTLSGEDPNFKTIEEGVTNFSIEDGVYNYYAITPCGNQSGLWNINVAKTLYITCKSVMPALALSKDSTGCEMGLYEYWSGHPGGVAFFGWNAWGSQLANETYDLWQIVVSSPQEVASVWNAHGYVNYGVGCYDKTSHYSN